MSMYDEYDDCDRRIYWDDDVHSASYKGTQCPNCGERDNYTWEGDKEYFTEAPCKYRRCNKCNHTWCRLH